MVLKLTEEQLAELRAAGDQPVEVVDAVSRRRYFVLTDEQLEKYASDWEQREWRELGLRALAQYDADEPWPADDK